MTFMTQMTIQTPRSWDQTLAGAPVLPTGSLCPSARSLPGWAEPSSEGKARPPWWWWEGWCGSRGPRVRRELMIRVHEAGESRAGRRRSRPSSCSLQLPAQEVFIALCAIWSDWAPVHRNVPGLGVNALQQSSWNSSQSEQGVPHFHFAQGPTNYIANPERMEYSSMCTWKLRNTIPQVYFLKGKLLGN